MPVSQDFNCSFDFRLFLGMIPIQNTCQNVSQFVYERTVEVTEAGHQRTPQDQVIQVNDFFFFSQEGYLAAGHGGIMLERRIIFGLVGRNFAAA